MLSASQITVPADASGRADLKTLAAGIALYTHPDPDWLPFRLTDDGSAVSAHFNSGALAAVCFRHACELSALLKNVDSDVEKVVRASFASARIALLFRELEDAQCDTAPPFYGQLTPLAGDESPSTHELYGMWEVLSELVPPSCGRIDQVSIDFEDLGRWLKRCWHLLAPSEVLMTAGGDARLLTNPATGLNRYGCSHRPRPWAITFASTTASSVSERGFASAEKARLRMVRACMAGREEEELRRLTIEVRQFLAAFYGLPDGERVILAASGTDCELAALAISIMGAEECAVSNVVIASDETGSGVLTAAQGRHFADETAHGVAVARGAFLSGFPESSEIADLPLRDASGNVAEQRTLSERCHSLIEELIARGRHVLMHRLDVSKTGLLAPDDEAMDDLRTAFPKHVDFVADACQARFAPARVRTLLASETAVMVTGSKFFTGPPFCGALLIPESWYERLQHSPLPSGLSDYAFRTEWPDCVATRTLPEGTNHGLILRWYAAMAEMDAFAKVSPDAVFCNLSGFLSELRERIRTSPHLHRITPLAPERTALPGADWDRLMTVETFLVRAPATTEDDFIPLDMESARQLHRWLNADLSSCPTIADQDIYTRAVAARLCHIGQPVAIPAPKAKGGVAGALRMAAGARLVSGEPSHVGLDAASRLARETKDMGLVIDKISLILGHWEDIAQHAPEPVFIPQTGK
ncbi:MAG: hypothetical protein GX413_07240 [Acetobacter sp.]|nr:hypothetical protein [Acetobacter sp.]